MRSDDPKLAKLDEQYNAALLKVEAAQEKLAEIAAKREAAYIEDEYSRSREAQRLANLSDEEWDALRQRVKAARGPKLEPEVPAPATE